MNTPAPTRHDVLILGAGMSGLAMAMALQRAGRHDFLIVDKSAGLGGTWWDNRYPGACVDVPAPLYSFSCAPHPGWQRRFAAAPEILAYMQGLASRHGLARHLRLGTAVRAANFDENRGRWLITLDSDEVIDARFFVCSTGPLSVPRWPAIEGLDSFAGPRLHSARWDNTVDMAGRRVGVIGTGSTASQLVPELAKQAARLTVFQRTPNWVLPRFDRAYGALDRLLFHVPGWNRVVRAFWAATSESFRRGFEPGSQAQGRLTALARGHMRRQLRGDEALRQQLQPTYPIGCKRIVFSNDYLRAFTQPQVQLETKAITRITATGVQLADGSEHPLDVLVCATGFDVQHSVSVPITGRGGALLQAQWADGAMAHLGTTVAGFPNLFLMLGPNTATGHTSTLLFIEPQLRFALRAMQLLDKRGSRWLDVRADTMQAFNDELQQRLQGSVWMQCRSWYRADNGRNVAIWPGYTPEYRRRLAQVDFEREFVFG
ncbi:MAG: NAD(P)/FAD-dependent oxidoreductase [Rubrivivax sp.]|nr:NAD(P)/FAD-dependent oxidoreductase [Rubrivivax sp.]